MFNAPSTDPAAEDQNSIAPVDPDTGAPMSGGDDGSDPIADYRRYLEQHTGDRAAGAGAPDPNAIPPAGQPGPPQGGAGPSIDGNAPQGAAQAGPAGPQPLPPAQAQSASIAPVGVGQQLPSEDVTAPLGQSQAGGAAPEAPQAPIAPQARKAPRAKGAPVAPQAPQAPTIDGGTPPASFGPQAAPRTALAPGPQPATGLTPYAPVTDKPAAGHVVDDEKTPDGRPMVATAPPGMDKTWFKGNGEDLSDVHTVDDLFNALKPSKQTKYMDWWEQQHGDINARYDAMKADLGQRPDPNREPTQKEKFIELMHFGLSLMQNAKRGNDPMAAVGASAQSALDQQQQRQQQQTNDYDQRAAGIEAQRQTQLKDIGNYGQAVREDAQITNANARTASDLIRTLKPPKPGQPVTRVLADNSQVQWNPESGKWEQSLDQNGKPLKVNPAIGARGGQGSARVQSLNDLIARGVDPNRAMTMVYGTGGYKPDDPVKTYTSIYGKALSAATAQGDPDPQGSAQREAEAQTATLHGPNWRQTVASRNQPALGGLPKVASDADYAKLPVGASYIAPDGKTYVKKAGQ